MNEPKLPKARPIGGGPDISAIQKLASRLWPLSWHPGGLGWALARGRLADEVVLFDGVDGPAGWGARGMDEPTYLLALADPSVPAVADAIAAWFKDVATAPEQTIEIAEADRTLLPALRRAGFGPRHEGTVLGMRHPALHARVAPLDGYVVRPVRPDETEARVEVHRAAWLPASLPYAAQHRPPVEPGATSSFTLAAYEAVRSTWLYDPAFDLVAVAPDGSLAACCIAWYDPASGVAEIEPLGVVPEHRGRGLAGALCHEVAARVGEAGGGEVFINAGPRPEYPAPGRAYARAGFEAYVRANKYLCSKAGTGAPAD
ncbi:MAG: GNAT family N-acetyltransferase [Candidatus Dormibacteraeota bacterium]|nr:GNAT family N-acetyltransferase [Candidatus Dormibacteraeota bacterium]